MTVPLKGICYGDINEDEKNNVYNNYNKNCVIFFHKIK